ncbi:hypothetical protein T492DRAFT_1058058 [Pavlovales sp. CCMP2436]|nr:hypothetical protein T492DRAFT_1058058 [Pavlovales sp. CCMP2436]
MSVGSKAPLTWAWISPVVLLVCTSHESNSSQVSICTGAESASALELSRVTMPNAPLRARLYHYLPAPTSTIRCSARSPSARPTSNSTAATTASRARTPPTTVTSTSPSTSNSTNAPFWLATCLALCDMSHAAVRAQYI